MTEDSKVASNVATTSQHWGYNVSTSYAARARGARVVSQTIKANKSKNYEQDGDGVLTAEEVVQVRNAWDLLVRNAHGISYAQAAFLKGLRARYPGGPSGLLQYRSFLRNVLHVTAGKAMIAIGFVGGTHRYSEKDWQNYGGLQGLMHLHNLPGNGWKKVRAALDARIAENGRPLTYGIIRNVALEMGYRSTSGKGRPTQSEMEQKCATLRAFIASCYKSGKLPAKLPANVAAAMSKSALETIREALSK